MTGFIGRSDLYRRLFGGPQLAVTVSAVQSVVLLAGQCSHLVKIKLLYSCKKWPPIKICSLCGGRSAEESVLKLMLPCSEIVFLSMHVPRSFMFNDSAP